MQWWLMYLLPALDYQLSGISLTKTNGTGTATTGINTFSVVRNILQLYRMPKKGKLIIFSALLFWTCSKSSQQSISYLAGSSITRFTKEVDSSYSYYASAKEWGKKLQLNQLEKGVNGFEMRLWNNPELVLRKKVISISYFAGIWNAKAYSIMPSRNDTAIDSIVDITPKSGWGEFQNKLTELQVWQLPNYTPDLGNSSMDDGWTYCVDIANQSSYRFTWFTNPGGYNKASRQWQNIVNLFYQEFEAFKTL